MHSTVEKCPKLDVTINGFRINFQPAIFWLNFRRNDGVKLYWRFFLRQGEGKKGKDYRGKESWSVLHPRINYQEISI